MKMINFAYSIFDIVDVVVNAPFAAIHAYLLRLCCPYFAPFRAFTSILYKEKTVYLSLIVQIFQKVAVLGRFSKFSQQIFFPPTGE